MISLSQIIGAVVLILVLRIIQKFIIKPYKELKALSTTPNAIVTFKIGSKKVKEWKNDQKATYEPTDKTNPFENNELYKYVLEHPTLRFTANNFAHRVMVTLQDKALITEFYKNGKCYRKLPRKSFLRTEYTQYGLSNVEGDEWKFQRKVISEIFHFENLIKTLPIMEETVKEFLEAIKFEGNSVKINVIDEFHKITGEIIGRTFFGESLNSYKLFGKPLTLALAEYLAGANSKLRSNIGYQIFGSLALLWSSKVREYRREALEIGEISRKIVRESIEKLEKNPPKTDSGRKGLLQILWEKSKTEASLNERELVANFIVFFIAGMDTTGHTVAMVVYFLSQYPEVKNKVIQEIEKNWDGKSELNSAALQRLEYLQATIDETLRMSTPAAGTFPREALQDHYLNDIHIKKGTIVFPFFIPSMFNRDLYTDVGVFRPERFIKGDPAYERPSDPFAYIPFSAGARNCIGQHMAIMEAKIILCHFLKMYDFELEKGYKLEMVQRFLLEPKIPPKFTITRRTYSA